MPELVFTVLAALVSVLTAAAGLTIKGNGLGEQMVRRLFQAFGLQVPKEPEKTYSERLSELTESLTKSSLEVDSVLQELASVAKEKESAVRELEGRLADFSQEEEKLKAKIAALQHIPIPVAEQFVKLLAPTERRSSRRDYILFVSGAVATTVINLLLQKVLGK